MTLRKGGMMETLTNEQLALLWQRNSHKKHVRDFALTELYRKNYGYFHKYAVRVKEPKLNYKDFFNHSVPHMIKALKAFDPTLGNKFFTFAVWRIQAALTTFNQSDASLVRAKVKKVVVKKKGKMVEKLKLVHWGEVSLEAKNREGQTMMDELKAKEPESPEDVKAYARAVLGFLTEREYDVVCKYYGISHKCSKNLREIGYEMGLTHEAIRQTKNKALKKIRGKIKWESAIETPIFKEMKQLYT